MSPSPFWPCDSVPSKYCQDLILPWPRMCLISWLSAQFSALACCLSRNTHRLFRHPIKSQLTSSSQTIKSLSTFTVALKKTQGAANQEERREMFTLTFQKLPRKAFLQPFVVLKNVDRTAGKLIMSQKIPHWKESLCLLKILGWFLPIACMGWAFKEQLVFKMCYK